METLFQSLLLEATVEQFLHRQGSLLLDVVRPAFPPFTKASPALQGVPKDVFRHSVVAQDMPEPCEFLSLDSCEKRFLCAHKEIDFALHPVVGLVLQVGKVS